MIEKYSKNKKTTAKLTSVQCNNFFKDIFKVGCDIDENKFDFSILLESDVKKYLHLLKNSKVDYPTALKIAFSDDIFIFSTGLDFQRNPYYQFVTFRDTGEMFKLNFDYFKPYNRFEMMIIVSIGKRNEMMNYERHGLVNDKNDILNFVENSWKILAKLDSIVDCYH